MATEHGGNTTLTRGVDRLGALVGDVLRRLGGESPVSDWTDRAGATDDGGRQSRSRRDGSAERLLTPEEHIVDAIERGGGAMKQSEVVATVDWSESTVSRKLSELESREAVSRYQIGREKLVYLPGHEPAAVESPLARAEAD